MGNWPPKMWEDISREERFFTSMLFHDVRNESDPFVGFLATKLNLDPAPKFVDIGYEVCFFRDAAFDGLIEREVEFEKQTFDLLISLSDARMVIIEAKAQQPFGTEQLEKLAQARSIIQVSKLWPVKTISLVGLHSSIYSPGMTTKDYFDATLTWNDVAKAYPANQDIYHRADSLYDDREIVDEGL